MKVNHIEIVLATLVVITSILLNLDEAQLYLDGNFTTGSFNVGDFKNHGLEFNFFYNRFLPLVVRDLTYYISFLWIACSYPNKFINKGENFKAMITVITGILISWAGFLSILNFTEPYNYNKWSIHAIGELKKTITLYTILLVYQVGKRQFSKLYSRLLSIKKPVITPFYKELMVFIALWIFSVAVCTLLDVSKEVGLFVTLILPCGVITYFAVLYWIIPTYYYPRQNLYTFWGTLLGISLIINIPFNGIVSSLLYFKWGFFVFFVLSWLLQLLFVIPLSFLVHQFRVELQNKISKLNSKLSISNANLDLLRSQINPHFLFNSLNTLYGMAITENAEKTSQGAQILGDMMRFMLQENGMERIDIINDIRYLENYVKMQKLRVANQADIELVINISETANQYKIAPMLLIPFVENAFKYGVFIKETTRIKIAVTVQDSELCFSVQNNVYQSSTKKPVKESLGIGIDNVRQRLELLYSNKHSLNIQNEVALFSVDLKIQLD